MASSLHKNPAKTFRPDPAEYARLRADLGDRTVDGFIVACMRCLHDEPDVLLTLLANYWPPEKPKGRPPKNA